MNTILIITTVVPITAATCSKHFNVLLLMQKVLSRKYFTECPIQRACCMLPVHAYMVTFPQSSFCFLIFLYNKCYISSSQNMISHVHTCSILFEAWLNPGAICICIFTSAFSHQVSGSMMCHDMSKDHCVKCWIIGYWQLLSLSLLLPITGDAKSKRVYYSDENIDPRLPKTVDMHPFLELEYYLPMLDIKRYRSYHSWQIMLNNGNHIAEHSIECVECSFVCLLCNIKVTLALVFAVLPNVICNTCMERNGKLVTFRMQVTPEVDLIAFARALCSCIPQSPAFWAVP